MKILMKLIYCSFLIGGLCSNVFSLETRKCSFESSDLACVEGQGFIGFFSALKQDPGLEQAIQMVCTLAAGTNNDKCIVLQCAFDEGNGIVSEDMCKILQCLFGKDETTKDAVIEFLKCQDNDVKCTLIDCMENKEIADILFDLFFKQ